MTMTITKKRLRFYVGNGDDLFPLKISPAACPIVCVRLSDWLCDGLILVNKRTNLMMKWAFDWITFIWPKVQANRGRETEAESLWKVDGNSDGWTDGQTDKLTDLGRTVIQKLHHVLQDLSPSGPPLKRKCCLLCSLALAVIRNWFYVVFCDLSMTPFDLEKGKNRQKTKTARKTQDGERQTGWQTSRQTDRDWQNWRETNRAP